MTRDEHDYQRLSRIPAPIATKEAQHRGVAIMRKAGGLTRAPNETASVKQPKLAGFLITQHHFAPWQGRGHPNRPTDDRRQRMGDVHGERGAMQFVGQIQLRDRKHSPTSGRKTRQLVLIAPILRTVSTMMVTLIVQAKTMLGIDKSPTSPQRHSQNSRRGPHSSVA